jgi:hypothetical protein
MLFLLSVAQTLVSAAPRLVSALVVSSLALGPPPSVEKSLDAAA